MAEADRAYQLEPCFLSQPNSCELLGKSLSVDSVAG